MAEDPFPRERVAATLRRMPAYLKLSWRLARDPLLSRARRAAVVAAAGYLASPVDLVPGFIPVIGQLDDLAFALAALRLALSGLDPARRREHLESVGLGDDDLAEDLWTLAITSAWLVRAGVRTTGRVVMLGGRAAVAGGQAAATGAKVAGRATARTAAAASRAAPAARTAAAKAAPAARAAAAKAGPTARGAVSKAGPATRDAAAKAAPAARSAAGKGIEAIRSMASKRPTTKVRVTIRRAPAIGPGRPVNEDRLPVEPDVIELPGPGGLAGDKGEGGGGGHAGCGGHAGGERP